MENITKNQKTILKQSLDMMLSALSSELNEIKEYKKRDEIRNMINDVMDLHKKTDSIELLEKIISNQETELENLRQ